MRTVQTLRGEIDTAALGTTLMHEHVFVLTPDLLQNYPSGWDEQLGVEDAVERLRRLKALGVDSIVDPTVVGLGRYIPRLLRVAEQLDLNIVAATGLYTYDTLPHQFDFVGPGTVGGGDDPMIEMFVRDITVGIAGTGVKAAFLKCAIDRPGLVPGVERTMRAVARAHRLTGAPITVHTDAHSQSGLVVQEVLSSEGVDLERVVIGHSGDSTDLDYLKRLADAGSLLGMDRFGLDLLLPFEERVATVAALCAAGYAERLVLAHDASCYIDWFPLGAPAEMAPNWHYEHISRDVLPALRERGVSDEQITTMMVANPRRYFEHTEAY
ncbi:hypothetical protein K6U06_13875 [Acidiferrimicrobium sp. IK]|uniref:phosphotriesterase family protein n=1 Tax=Acidiferrimicrobium sp. IK TaxID=2871700 RepID=UPI0021CB6D22|nr:hypothetical protein [Acidiferrimicrobium sp. IK]MCU4185457.1 hypothetical protein [Acidiferrimicrobium sp. IK]